MRSFAHWLAARYRKIRLLALGHRKSWQKIGMGLWMYLDPDDPTDQSIWFRAYERALVRCIASSVRPGGICVDVGAEKGYATLHLARAVGSEGRVVAFEPDRRAAEELSRNVARNGFGSIVMIHQLAVSDTEGVCDFALTSQLGNSSRWPNEFARQQVISRITVRTKSLDQVLEEMGIVPGRHTIEFVKIDAEGSEPLIVKGMRGVLEHFRPAIWLEINRFSLRAGGFSETMIERPLREAGYVVYRPIEFRDAFLRVRFRWAKVEMVEKELGDLFNIFAVPDDRSWQVRVKGLVES